MAEEDELDCIDVTVSIQDYVKHQPPAHLDRRVTDLKGREIGSIAPVVLPGKGTRQLAWVFTPKKEER